VVDHPFPLTLNVIDRYCRATDMSWVPHWPSSVDKWQTVGLLDAPLDAVPDPRVGGQNGSG
jgi:hypothetical protein